MNEYGELLAVVILTVFRKEFSIMDCGTVA
jgi:hypothetical protein